MGRTNTNAVASARGSADQRRGVRRPGYHELCREMVRERLLDAACEQLRDAPWERLSMIDVAALADVHRSSLYNEFGTRRNLARALIAREAARLSSGLGQALALSASTPADALEATFDCFLKACNESGLIAAMLRPGETELRALAAARKGEVLGRLSGSIAEAWPVLPKTECDQIAHWLFRFALSLERKPPNRSTARHVGAVLGAYVEHRLGTLQPRLEHVSPEAPVR